MEYLFPIHLKDRWYMSDLTTRKQMDINFVEYFRPILIKVCQTNILHVKALVNTNTKMHPLSLSHNNNYLTLSSINKLSDLK